MSEKQPIGWIVLRDTLTPAVGLFATEAAANAWQQADVAANGELNDEWSTWPVYAPADAFAFATPAAQVEPQRD